jgi:hypothetical protein
MKRKKEDYFVIGLAVILVLIVFGIAFLAFRSQPETQSPSVEPFPSPTPQGLTTKPPVVYNPEAQDKLLEKIKSRPAISNEDFFSKAQILASLPQGETSGVLYESPTIRIDYTQSADIFQVEILTIDVQAAKDEANVWFRNKGVSQEGICNYPVQFYLNYDVAEKLKEMKGTFNPLGNSC